MSGLIKIIVAVLLPTTRNVNRQNTVKPALPEQGIPSNTLITLTRTACYGNCPIYNLTVCADGKVIYVGK